MRLVTSSLSVGAVLAALILSTGCNDPGGPDSECIGDCLNNQPPPGTPAIPVPTSYLDNNLIIDTTWFDPVPLTTFKPIIAAGSPSTIYSWAGDPCLVVFGKLEIADPTKNNCQKPTTACGGAAGPDCYQGWNYWKKETGVFPTTGHRPTLMENSQIVSAGYNYTPNPDRTLGNWDRQMYDNNAFPYWDEYSPNFGRGNPYVDHVVYFPCPGCAGAPQRRLFVSDSITKKPYIRLLRFWEVTDGQDYPVIEGETFTRAVKTSVGRSSEKVNTFMKSTSFTFELKATAGDEKKAQASAGFTFSESTQNGTRVSLMLYEARQVETKRVFTCGPSEKCRYIIWTLVDQLEIVDANGEPWQDENNNVKIDESNLRLRTSDAVVWPWLTRFPF